MTTLSKARQLTTRLLPLLFPLLLAGLAWGQSPTLSADSFGFQCGIGAQTNCPKETWPPTQAQPGVLRLWDAGVSWGELNQLNNQQGYSWTNLNKWLDAIASHQPRQVIYTFGWTPCWDATGGCGTRGSNYPPKDLGITTCTPNDSGSKSFCDFVTQLLQHCSPANNCVSTYIQDFELWNEANDSHYWGDGATVGQLYQMMAPAVAIIKQKIPAAKILTPPISNAGGASGFQGWACSWLAEEVAHPISDIYAFHTYLQDNIPENQCCSPNSLAALQLAPNKTYSTTCSPQTGWSEHPWWVTETNYNVGPNQDSKYPWTCDLDKYTAADCAGQILRWQAIINSNGGFNLTWYYWNTSIGEYNGNPQNENEIAYYWMMQYLNFGHFTAACSVGSGTTWTCPFAEVGGQSALFVWTTNDLIGHNYTLPVPNPYVDYRDLQGNTTKITPTETTVPISAEPIMLETSLTTN